MTKVYQVIKYSDADFPYVVGRRIGTNMQWPLFRPGENNILFSPIDFYYRVQYYNGVKGRD